MYCKTTLIKLFFSLLALQVSKLLPFTCSFREFPQLKNLNPTNKEIVKT